MAKTLPKILLVDDEPKFLNSIAERLKLMGFDPLKASGGLQALSLARNNPIDLAIVDLKMPDMDGLVTITKLKEIFPDLKSVLLTGHGNEKVKQATEALDAAYVEKDRMEDFWDIIKQSSQGGSIIVIKPPSAAGSESRAAVYEPRPDGPMPDSESVKDILGPPAIGKKKVPTDPPQSLRMIGETLAMQELRKNIERLAALDCPVIIRGETGTGKELAARVIHNLSPRRQNRFIAVNCGCFSNDLLIEELFSPGNTVFPGDVTKRGPDTGWDSGGTILLDQIEELSPKMQLSMLKIIDSKKEFPRNSGANFPFDVRILAASIYNLGKLVEEGKFREELYYRLNVLELHTPPLRERRDDIPPLCGYFLEKYAKEFKKPVDYISDDVTRIFMAYDFPGNVRELEHIIERAVILADGKTIESKHLPGRFQGSDPKPPGVDQPFMTLAEMEKQYIFKVLDATGGKKSKAVELLGISRAALWRKLKQFKLENQHPPAADQGRKKTS